MKFGMGQSVRRTEDVRFVTGRGQYTDDMTTPDQAHAAVVRSPHAHARVLSVDVEAARRAPGVLAILTHKDIAHLGTMPCLAPIKSRDGSDFKPTPLPLLAQDRVRWVGQPVAFVVAETQTQARDAAALVEVDYDAMPAAGTIGAASAEGAPTVWDHAPGNLCFDWAAGNAEAVDAAFKSAAHTVSLDVVQNRVVANAMEPRAAIGAYDKANDHYTLTTNGQGTTMLRGVVARMMLKVKPEQLRVIQPDVGGGFGMKAFMYPEQVLVLEAAKIAGRPVKWAGDRAEAFMADCHGRDMETRGELALDKDGRITAMRISGTANLGGYLSQYAPFIPTMGGSRVFGGVYRIPALSARIRGYLTNTAPVDAYRGAGRPEAAYFLERLMDLAARKLKIDQAEIRRRNLIAPSELPYTNWTGMAFDSGEFVRNLDEAVAKSGWTDFAARKAESAKRGRLRGHGLAYYVEITGGQANEPVAIKFTENGGVEAYVGTLSNGQGHETSFAQVLSEKLGVPFEAITIKQGDTDFAVHGGGTGGSRSLHMAGGAILAASDEIVRKGKRAAGHLLEAAEADIEFTTASGVGRFNVVGTDRGLTLMELARESRKQKVPGFEAGLDTHSEYQGANSTFPNGCHICEVEIDRDTGKADIVAYTVVDDFGRVINPMLVAGQVHGGIAQGIGQALIENCVYDPESGQLVTGSFMDYGMPRADDMPSFDFNFNEIPCKTNPLGVKGAGEAGTVGALPATINAIVDALAEFGVSHIDMPATPEKIWAAIQGA